MTLTSGSGSAAPLDPAVEGLRFIGAIIMLMAIGMFFLYSASSYRSSVTGLNSASMWLGQLKGYGLGCLLFAVGYLVSPRRWLDMYWLPLWGGVVLLLVATRWSPLGIEINDAHRWLDLGIRFQPSELAKFCIPISTIALTGTIRYRGLFGWPVTVRSGSVIAAALIGVPSAVIILQPDFGSALFILVLGAIPLLRWLKLCWYACLWMLPLALISMNVVVARWGEMQQRFMAVHSPEQVPQVWAGLQGIGSGGLWGKGIGMGSSKTLFMPSEYSDFIFSVYAEETGFIGVLCLASLYLLVLVFGWRLSRAVEDSDLACLVRVVTIAITGQAAINLLVNVALFPTKGIPLPFFSHGSTGLAVFMGMTGVVMAISRSRVRQVVSVT